MNWNKIHVLYTELNTLSRRNDWTALEEHFYQFAEKHARTEMANRILSIDLGGYISALNQFLVRECQRLSHHAVRAIYFEYNLDLLWESTLFICDRYNREIAGSEDWAMHWIDKSRGPDLAEFAQVYAQYGGFQNENEKSIGLTFYLVARTVAAFGRAIDPVPTHKMAICIAHHGQRKITRIYE